MRPSRATLALSGALLVVLSTAAPASAHVEIDPAEAPAGATIALALTFHHGLHGSATTGLAVQLPVGARLVSIPPKEGWTAAESSEGGRTVMTWTGGRIPDGEEAAFLLEVTLPSEPGEARFPTIQTTEAGELAWIEADESDSEDATPAPRLTLVGDGTAVSSSSTSSSTSTTPSTTLRLPGTTSQAEERDDGDESPAPWLVGGGIAAAVIVGAGGWWLSRRA